MMEDKDSFIISKTKEYLDKISEEDLKKFIDLLNFALLIKQLNNSFKKEEGELWKK